MTDPISSPWQRWDSIWYTKIAERGYSSDDLSTAFFPLYPLAIRAVITFLPINSVSAGIIVSTFASLVAFLMIFHLVQSTDGEMVARRALVYLATYPLAFILFAAYPEALFLACAVGAWLSAQSGRWAYAGLLGGLAGMTRGQGILLVLPFALLFLNQYRAKRIRLAQALWFLPFVFGSLFHLLYVFQLGGSPFGWLSIMSVWNRFSLPWETIGASLTTLIQGTDLGTWLFALRDMIAFSIFAILLIVSAAKRHWEEALFIAIILVPPLFTTANYQTALPLAPLTRYLVLAFPGFILLGQFNLRSPWVFAIAIVSLFIQTILLVAFTHWVFIV
jgi:hypothetical protein